MVQWVLFFFIFTEIFFLALASTWLSFGEFFMDICKEGILFIYWVLDFLHKDLGLGYLLAK